jgi:hypothetical protein
MHKNASGVTSVLPAGLASSWRSALTGSVIAVIALSGPPAVLASENVPHAPFAQWADVPAPGQLVTGLFYDESEAYHIWAKNEYNNITVHSGGERYGIDINQGWLTLQYGITKQWAADLSIGYTTVGWRAFDIDQHAESTTGLMDTSFGIRYQAFNETTAPSPWIPTLTLRAGAVLPGTYQQDFPFAPGVRSAAVEPEVLARKHFGWPGFGAYGDALFRWNRTTANDQYVVALGLFQQIKGWEIQAGYRHLGTISGDDIVYNPATPWTIHYPVAVRENNDSIEAGFNYTLPKKKWQFGFYSRTVLDGSNSDGKFWFGGYVNIPFQILKPNP